MVSCAVPACLQVSYIFLKCRGCSCMLCSLLSPGLLLALQAACQRCDVELMPAGTHVCCGRLTHGIDTNSNAALSKVGKLDTNLSMTCNRCHPAARRRLMCCPIASCFALGSSFFLKLSLWLRQSATLHPSCSEMCSQLSSFCTLCVVRLALGLANC